MSAVATGKVLVTDFGAAGDGTTLDTAAIQQALDTAGSAGGVWVVVPPGHYRIGTIHLHDNTTLELLPGATLVGSSSLDDYTEMTEGHNKDRTRWHLIVAQDARNVTICGGGAIDGNGPAFWDVENRRENGWIPAKARRPSPMIDIIDCTDVRLTDITLTNSPGWTCHTHRCDRVLFRGVRIENDLFGPNTDGFDIDGCHDVVVSDCFIRTGDDAICLKTTPDSRTCERVTVTNCTCETNCVALKAGSSESYHDMRQVTFSNCICYGSTRGIGLYVREGATYEDFTFSNIVIDTRNEMRLNRPIIIDANQATEESAPGRIRNVLFSNISIATDGRIVMAAQDKCRIEDVVLRDVHMRYYAVDDPDPIGREVKSSQFVNHALEPRIARAAVVGYRLQNLVLTNLSITWPEHYHGNDFHAILLRDCHGGFINAPLARATHLDWRDVKLQECEVRVREHSY